MLMSPDEPKHTNLVWGVLYPCRVLGFRKRAQSAEEESSASLQHLTLTEFLKEYVFHQNGLTAMHVWLNSF